MDKDDWEDFEGLDNLSSIEDDDYLLPETSFGTVGDLSNWLIYAGIFAALAFAPLVIIIFVVFSPDGILVETPSSTPSVLQYESEILSAFETCGVRQAETREELWQAIECARERGVVLDFDFDRADQRFSD